jgi:cyclophilin family peptidyl-prolyl cis-trans isomerase
MFKYLLVLVFSFSIYIVNAQTYKVLLTTSEGKLLLQLFDDVPQHQQNFVKLIKNKNLDSTLFHRVINSFMIQAGDPDSKRAKPGDTLGNGDLGYLVPAEIMPAKHIHTRGALAAARDDRPDKASSACQFYIVQGKPITSARLDTIQVKRGYIYAPQQREEYYKVGGTPHLDNNYTVFGKLLKGYDVLNKIALVPRDANDRPLKDIRILKTKLIKRKKFILF